MMNDDIYSSILDGKMARLMAVRMTRNHGSNVSPSRSRPDGMQVCPRLNVVLSAETRTRLEADGAFDIEYLIIRYPLLRRLNDKEDDWVPYHASLRIGHRGGLPPELVDLYSYITETQATLRVFDVTSSGSRPLVLGEPSYKCGIALPKFVAKLFIEQVEEHVAFFQL